MKEPNDSRFQADEVDKLIECYDKPLTNEHKRDLLAKLNDQRKTFIKAHTKGIERPTGNDQGHSR